MPAAMKAAIEMMDKAKPSAAEWHMELVQCRQERSSGHEAHKKGAHMA
jgi:hypothetical protein